MNVAVIVVPFDSAQRGVRMGAGPARLLEAGLADRLRAAGHDVSITEVELGPAAFRAEIRTAFVLAATVQRDVADAIRRGAFPLVLSGNCNSSLGTVAGLRAGAAKEIGVAWFDAHGDFNTPETTVGGFLDGMALATLVGDCWTELSRIIPGFEAVAGSNVLLLGARHFDALELKRLEQSTVCRLGSEEIPAGLAQASDPVLGGSDALYVHVDLDVLDPSHGRANGFSVAGGISPGVLVEAIDVLGRAVPIRAAALTAYDPAADDDGRVAAIALEVAVRLVGAARWSRPVR